MDQRAIKAKLITVPSRRVCLRWLLFALAVPAALFLSAWWAHGEMIHPAGVPDLSDPAVQARFVPLTMGGLDGDPDFPALFLRSVTEDFPQFLLVIVDARNGKESWSLREDPAIFFLLLADGTMDRQAFLDEGFADEGSPSGTFIMSTGPDAIRDALHRLRESHTRVRSSAGLVTVGLPGR